MLLESFRQSQGRLKFSILFTSKKYFSFTKNFYIENINFLKNEEMSYIRGKTSYTLLEKSKFLKKLILIT